MGTHSHNIISSSFPHSLTGLLFSVFVYMLVVIPCTLFIILYIECVYILLYSMSKNPTDCFDLVYYSTYVSCVDFVSLRLTIVVVVVLITRFCIIGLHLFFFYFQC